MVSLVLLRLDGMSPTIGVQGWRATGHSGGIGRAGEVEVSHYTYGRGLIVQPLVMVWLRASG